MKKLFVICISVFISTNWLMAIANNEQPRDPIIIRSFPASSIRSVEVSTSGGSITVSGDADSQAVVEVYVSRDDRWSDDQIRQMLKENYNIEIDVRNGKLYAVAKAKNNKMNRNTQRLSISFKISVPRQVNSLLNTSGGSIKISNMSGSQDFKTSGGSLMVENVSGKIVGRTSGGSINVTGASDEIDLKTSGGSINATNCSGKIELRTSGGSIRLTELNGNINASTSGGSINANNIKGALNAGTSGGSINVTMESVIDYLKLSSSGNVNLTLPAGKGYNLNVKANANIQTSQLDNFRGNIDSKNMAGTIANGGPEIDVKASKVSLIFK